MSRANPTASSPNPCSTWFEWKGEFGQVSHYDKEKKERVIVPTPFKFIVLDTLSTVTGYNKKLKSGIYANEVRNISADPLVVKFFKGEEIANGLWSAIKKDVAYENGKFCASVYIAFRESKEAPMQIGNIKMNGCALGPWFDFQKKSRADIDAKGVTMKAGTKDTSGSVDFVPPVFSISEITGESNTEAQHLADTLAIFLKGYLKRPVDETLDQRTSHQAEDENQDYEEAEATARRPQHPSDPHPSDEAELDIPF